MLCTFAFFVSACSELQQPTPEKFFAETVPPRQQEFRWSNGQMPKSLDPAFAAAPPETDIVRALYEGLTDLDPKTLKEVPGVAERWSSSSDLKTWTFYLRKDARWSNGDPVTAKDFVRSWTRLASLGERAAHHQLVRNIVGLEKLPGETAGELPDFLTRQPGDTAFPITEANSNTNSNSTSVPYLAANSNISNIRQDQPERTGQAEKNRRVGVEAVSDRELKVTLKRPDNDLPKLVANPIFRPVHNAGKEFVADKLNPKAVTNGPFRIADLSENGITLERAEGHWRRDEIKLDRVHFVPMPDAESALQAYRDGQLDAVTNAEFKPLVLKLLSPYEDFRVTTHSALNFYEFNLARAPFNDRRVREALAIAIDRERLTEAEMKGATQPAYSFMPFNERTGVRISQDNQKAKDLLSKAGYPDGENFPEIELLINRNDTQQRIARSVVRMWKENLNVEATIVVKDASEIEAARENKDFDIVRRGVVLPTTDEAANFMAIFPPRAEPKSEERPSGTPDAHASPSATATPAIDVANVIGSEKIVVAQDAEILSEEQAIFELYAIPLYFPTSYSLIKPYIHGFDTNSLDAPALHSVVIDSNWQPKKPVRES